MLLIVTTIVGYFVLTSSRSKSGISPSTPIAAVQEGNITLSLYGTGSMPASSDRIMYYPSPVTPHIGTEPSATSLSSNSNSKFYCVVTVECIGNTSWGTQGKKTFVWNVASTSKVIQAPKNYQFKLYVHFYERCGPHYTSGGYGRSVWTASAGTTSYSTTKGLSGWSNLGRYTCN